MERDGGSIFAVFLPSYARISRMTVRVERTVTVPAPPERVWEFIADPDSRAAPISVIEEWDVHEDGSATWYLSLPIPLVDTRVAVETRDDERRPPEYVKFTGRSKVMQVQGEHVLEAVDGGTKLINRFVVDGRRPRGRVLPGPASLSTAR